MQAVEQLGNTLSVILLTSAVFAGLFFAYFSIWLFVFFYRVVKRKIEDTATVHQLSVTEEELIPDVSLEDLDIKRTLLF